jgi:hypothetical protein
VAIAIGFMVDLISLKKSKKEKSKKLHKQGV